MILQYLEAKFDYAAFMLFYHWSLMILHNNNQVILCKIEGVTAIYAFFYFYIFEGSLDFGTPHVTPFWDPRRHWSTMRQFFQLFL